MTKTNQLAYQKLVSRYRCMVIQALCILEKHTTSTHSKQKTNKQTKNN